MNPRRVTVATMAALAILAMPFHSYAGQPSQSAREQALTLSEMAAKRYNERDYDAAIMLLLESRSLYPEPLLLFNLGLAYEKKGDSERALDAYAQYLRERPTAPDRKDIEARIAALRAKVDPAPVPAAETPPPAPLSNPPGVAPPAAPATVDVIATTPAARRSPLPWVTMGVGAAAIGTGAILVFVSRAWRVDAHNQLVHQDAVASHGKAKGFATAANAALWTGGALVVTGIVWRLLDRRPAAAVTLGPDGLTLAGRF